MNRRNVLAAIASIVSGASGAGAALVAADDNLSTTGGATGASSPTQTSFIETRDRMSLFYKDWGKGRPVVFLSGWALNSDMWSYQMLYLASHGLRCIAYDRRGHGRSSQPGFGYDYDTLADDLAAVIERLDLREATLVGHSMSGGEIARYLSRHGAGRIALIECNHAITETDFRADLRKITIRCWSFTATTTNPRLLILRGERPHN